MEFLRQIPVYEGAPEKDSMTVTTIPAGTLLFRMFHMEDTPRGESLFRDFFGIPTPEGFCLPPTYNTYFYPFPYVGFGLFNFYDQSPSWNYFNACTIYVTTQDMTFATMLSPSMDFRGVFQVYKQPSALVKRCSQFPLSRCLDAEPAETRGKYIGKLEYDNCMNPTTRGSANLGGMIAIANLDSLDQKRVVNNIRTKENVPIGKTALGTYLRCLASYQPAKVTQILSSLYMDRRGNRGIPEIAMHPLIPSLSNPEDINRPAATFEDSVALLADDMKASRLSFMPVATITDKAVFSYGGARAVQSGTTSPNERRKRIEQNLESFLTDLRTKGFPGLGRLMYDMRTGFFCAEGLQKGDYKDLLLPLRNAEDVDTVETVKEEFKGPATPETADEGNMFLFQRPDVESIRAALQTGGRRGRKTRRQTVAVTQPLNRPVNRGTLLRATTLRSPPKPTQGGHSPIPTVIPTNPQPLTNEAASQIAAFYVQLGALLRQA